MKWLLIIFSAVSVTYLASCGVDCNDPPFLGLTFTGFDSSELTGVLIIQQQKGMLKPVHTTVCSSTASAGSDTIKIHYEKQSGTSDFYADFSLDPNYDYAVKVLPAGQVHEITGISITHKKFQDPDHQCTNPVDWNVDGTHHLVHEYTSGVMAGPDGAYAVVIAK